MMKRESFAAVFKFKNKVTDMCRTFMAGEYSAIIIVNYREVN